MRKLTLERALGEKTPTDKSQFTEFGGQKRYIFKVRDLSRFIADRTSFDCDYVKVFKLEKSTVKNRMRAAQRVAESFYSELMDYIFTDMIENGHSFCLSDKHTRIEPYRVKNNPGIGFFMDLDGVDVGTKRERAKSNKPIPVVKICYKKDFFRMKKLARVNKYPECILEDDLEKMIKKQRIKSLRNANNIQKRNSEAGT